MYRDENPLLGLDKIQAGLSKEDPLYGFFNSICESYVAFYIPKKRHLDYLFKGLGRAENTQGELIKFIVFEKKI
jgi:hypothetical protein